MHLLTWKVFLHLFFVQVSAVTDQTGMQDIGANTGDFDDDEGGGLVSDKFFTFVPVYVDYIMNGVLDKS